MGGGTAEGGGGLILLKNQLFFKMSIFYIPKYVCFVSFIYHETIAVYPCLVASQPSY